MFYYVNRKCENATLGKGSFVTGSANNVYLLQWGVVQSVFCLYNWILSFNKPNSGD